MNINKQQKLFGIGPLGALISFVLLAISVWVNRVLEHSVILANPFIFKIIGIMAMVIGLGLHFWSMWALRNWWNKDKLCISGPFRWFRHPMYAAWITFVLPGLALYLNSWIILIFVAALHPVWHLLVTREEIMMFEKFRDEYRTYASQTGRFFPRIWRS